jgi:hypothetical protein
MKVLTWKKRIVLVLLMAAMTGGTFTCSSSNDHDDDASVNVNNQGLWSTKRPATE